MLPQTIQIINAIPPSRVSSYRDIAAGLANGARQVALHSLTPGPGTASLKGYPGIPV
ncbi:MAG: hypothetical protein LBT13_06405 [Treponema sp.]|nr:hypothetical protein [Treponema sp.]